MCVAESVTDRGCTVGLEAGSAAGGLTRLVCDAVAPSPNDHWVVRSSLPGSVEPAANVAGTPSVTKKTVWLFHVVAPLVSSDAVGATFVTVAVAPSTSLPPSSSATVTETGYEPLSPYVYDAVKVAVTAPGPPGVTSTVWPPGVPWVVPQSMVTVCVSSQPGSLKLPDRVTVPPSATAATGRGRRSARRWSTSR